MKLKFGAAIDKDAAPAFWMDPTESPGILGCAEEDWDCDEIVDSLTSVVRRLISYPSPLYRAWIDLGMASDCVCNHLSRDPCDDNPDPLALNSWSLGLGPVECGGVGSSALYCPGWIEIAVSGYGYLFPWTFRDLVKRADSQPDLIRLKDLCRSTWPVPRSFPDDQQKDVLREMGDLWPYPVDAPFDWVWGLDET
jgi:hypothetical protein